jgi:hypothetical protein
MYRCAIRKQRVAVQLNINMGKINKYVSLAQEMEDMWRLAKEITKSIVTPGTGLMPHTLIHTVENRVF